ncbi:hypothetical protein G3O08_19765 [Cryomorpha ignava]|uniref:Acyltransferase n=1 Tax=Cryomorpha ignava TaxID=101383 RepID=A0A7K3WXB6_9FLAO|nr:acyltransferase [Cryomorpha ignava]NEN25731.1 hypothetical protein [Cryomorpha ignava]
MTKFYEYLLALRYRLNGWRLSLYLRSLGCTVGKNLKCMRFPTFRDIPKGNYTIGDNVVIGQGVIFEITQTGCLIIGDEVLIGAYTRFSSTAAIKIGNWAGIAENCSIRGSAHHLKRNQKYMKQGNVGKEISIGDDVLIGACSQVLIGAQIPEGVVIGALSLVTQHVKLHSYGIFAGAPVKHIRDRE